MFLSDENVSMVEKFGDKAFNAFLERRSGPGPYVNKKLNISTDEPLAEGIWNT